MLTFTIFYKFFCNSRLQKGSICVILCFIYILEQKMYKKYVRFFLMTVIMYYTLYIVDQIIFYYVQDMVKPSSSQNNRCFWPLSTSSAILLLAVPFHHSTNFIAQLSLQKLYISIKIFRQYHKYRTYYTKLIKGSLNVNLKGQKFINVKQKVSVCVCVCGGY